MDKMSKKTNTIYRKLSFSNQDASTNDEYSKFVEKHFSGAYAKNPITLKPSTNTPSDYDQNLINQQLINQQLFYQPLLKNPNLIYQMSAYDYDYNTWQND